MQCLWKESDVIRELRQGSRPAGLMSPNPLYPPLKRWSQTFNSDSHSKYSYESMGFGHKTRQGLPLNGEFPDLFSLHNIMSSLPISYSSNITAYPQGGLHRSTYWNTLFDTTALPYNKQYNNCKNTLCYTQNKGTSIYQPHTAYGMVGTTSASYLARRRRL